MKQCPACRTTYTDDTLQYCLADGSTLVAADTEAETIVRHGVRVDIEQPRSKTQPTQFIPTSPGRGSSGTVLKVVIAILVLGLLGLLVAGGAGAIYYFSSSGTSISVATPTPKPSPTSSPTIDPEKERLQKELANLQRQIDEDKRAEATKTPPVFESDEFPTARVNSPNDGFLALRSEPDAEKGERLAQIPHGTVVTLENCEKEKVKIGNRTGRWCMVTYRGTTGWVFDAWLEY